MKIKTNWNVGNFSVTLEGEVSEEQIPLLVEKGVLQVAQRQSEIDKVLGIVKKVGEKTVRSGVKRNEVPYSDEVALNLGSVFETLKISDDEEIELTVEVTEYVPTAGEIKFAFEKSLLAEKVAGGKSLADIAKGIEFEGETGEAPDYTPEFLRAVKSFLDNLRKSGI